MKNIEPYTTVDPDFTGYRGVYYKENNIFKRDLITRINGAGTMEKITKTFIFKGDTLFVNYIPG